MYRTVFCVFIISSWKNRDRVLLYKIDKTYPWSVGSLYSKKNWNKKQFNRKRWIIRIFVHFLWMCMSRPTNLHISNAPVSLFVHYFIWQKETKNGIYHLLVFVCFLFTKRQWRKKLMVFCCRIEHIPFFFFWIHFHLKCDAYMLECLHILFSVKIRNKW